MISWLRVLLLFFAPIPTLLSIYLCMDFKQNARTSWGQRPEFSYCVRVRVRVCGLRFLADSFSFLSAFLFNLAGGLRNSGFC
jgi:hypothetical protein